MLTITAVRTWRFHPEMLPRKSLAKDDAGEPDDQSEGKADIWSSSSTSSSGEDDDEAEQATMAAEQDQAKRNVAEAPSAGSILDNFDF